MTTRAIDPVARLEAAVRVLTGDVAAAADRLDKVANDAASALGAAAAAHKVVLAVSEAVDELTDSAGESEDPRKDVVPPWLVEDDPARAVVRLAELVEWLGAVYGQWRDARLGDCWCWHPAAVAELVALRDAWVAAYSGPRASPAAVMDWHERYRPGTVARVARELSGCSLQQHSAGRADAYRPPRVDGADQADDLAAWWARTHGAEGAPPPTAAVIAAAKARLAAR